jgi:hypothetical protein
VIHVSDEKKDDFWGEPIYSYGDSQAVDDGVLIPFVTNSGDTGHGITRNAFEELKDHYRQKGCAEYSELDFARFLFSELFPLVPFAVKEYHAGGIPRSDYDFRVNKTTPEGQTPWFLPNERNGITIMKQEDY